MATAIASPSVPVEARAPQPNPRSRKRLVWQAMRAFAAVTATYWCYWLVAVPLIEPSVEEEVAPRVSEERIGEARQEVTVRQSEVAQYFPEDYWERDNPAIWQSEQTRLLFKTLTPQPDGSVELKPCTVLFFSKRDADAAEPAQPIILRSLEGAIVRFDQPVVLKSVDLTKRELVGGNLRGPIRIYRNPSRAGANDDLEITTRDVQMLKDRVWTPHPVDFRLGRNVGRGREMEIMLAPAEGASGKAFKSGAVRTLELKRDVRMQLEMGAGPMQPRAARPQPAAGQNPLEITCQGPFQFDVERYAATFRKSVDVFRLNPAGESDQLNCELLTVYFESHRAKSPQPEPSTPVPPGQQDPSLSALQVRLIEARGDPVTVRSAAQGLEARCHGIDYSPGLAGAPGRLVAIGPGILQGHMPNDPAAKYDALWTREMRFEPDGNQHVAVLRGGAVVRYNQMGKITADEIFAWMTQVMPPVAAPTAGAPPAGAPPVSPPPGAATADPAQPGSVAAAPQSAPAAPPEPKWQLERLLAQVYPDKTVKSQGAVVIDAPQLIGTTSRLEAWVERPVATAPADPNAVVEQPAKPPRKANQPNQNSSQRFDVRGGLIRLQVVPEGEQLALSALSLENQARLLELTPREGEKPLFVQGDRVHLTGANTDATHVRISGRPGLLEAGGMTLTGGAIDMEKETSRLWVDGPGKMTMPMSQDLNGQKLAEPQNMDVTWQKRMDFVSDTVVYQGGVLARSQQQFVRTETLEAILNKPIDFSNPNPKPAARGAVDDRPQLVRVRCYGPTPTYLESVQFDERGQQSSFDQLEAVDLSLDRVSGAVHARGPGWVTHVARGSNQAMRARGGPDGAQAKPAAPPRAAKADDDQLTYLNVQFADAIDGNINERAARFGNRTTSVYGPIEDWKDKLSADNPAQLGPEGFVLTSDQLYVRQMPPRDSRQRGWFELEAVGFVIGEGAEFTARGNRLSYSEDKDLLVLRGDGQTAAELFREDPTGGPRQESRGQELKYWFGLNRAAVMSMQSIDLAKPKSPKEKGKDKKAK